MTIRLSGKPRRKSLLAARPEVLANEMGGRNASLLLCIPQDTLDP
jgi:hypothetical protein